MKSSLASGCLVGFVTWVSFVLGSALVAADGPELRVMSFNIRYGTAPDGENHWDRRKDFLVETILAFQPDLLGTQETLAFQRDFLAEKLTDYRVLGVGREDGKEQGEIMAIYWRKDRFEVLDSGHFWLSTTPETPGSKSWDSALPRMVTWIKLRDLKQPDARPILWMNTHFDHRGEQARQESARLVRAKLGEMGEGCSLIVTGDFNAAEGSQPYQLLFGEIDGVKSPVVDSFRMAHPERGTEEGTFSGFRAENVSGARIDWIACSRDWRVIQAGIDRTSRDGRTPSDHFPVFAILAR
jgi:endonuclease/exonuclease/phosphatase family metal-dependent hydrolase